MSNKLLPYHTSAGGHGVQTTYPTWGTDNIPNMGYRQHTQHGVQTTYPTQLMTLLHITSYLKIHEYLSQTH